MTTGTTLRDQLGIKTKHARKPTKARAPKTAKKAPKAPRTAKAAKPKAEGAVKRQKHEGGSHSFCITTAKPFAEKIMKRAAREGVSGAWLIGRLLEKHAREVT